MKSWRYYLRKIWKMDKLPEWLMFFTVLTFSILSYIITQDSKNIANESNYIANESRRIAEDALKISENALEVSRNVYTILELEKTPKIIITYEPSCYDFNSYRDVDITLKNIGGLRTNFTIKILTNGFYCFVESDSFKNYLFDKERDDWKDNYYRDYEANSYFKFINFTEEYGNNICKKEALMEGQDWINQNFKIYMEPYLANNSTASFRFEVDCENPIYKKIEIIKSNECIYSVYRPISIIPFASFIKK